MLLGFDLHHLLLFPVKNAEARKAFAIGSALMGISIIVPIIPYFIILGYVMQIMRQVYEGTPPSMIKWDNWELLFKNGAKLFGVRFVYTLPITIAYLAFLLLGFFSLLLLANDTSRAESGLALIGLLIITFTVALMPFIIVVSIVVFAAEAHTVYENSFSAGFKTAEWWKIFRANWTGFALAYLIFYGVITALTFIYQIIILSLVLICILPVFLPVMSMYASLILYPAIAQAYKAGRDKLAPVRL